MFRTPARSRLARGALTGALALGLTVGATLAASVPATAAAGAIAVPNGMVGVQQQIVIYAPNATGQVVTLGIQLAGFSTTLQTTVGSNGYGSMNWTPASSGTWTFNGLGTIASLGSTTAFVAPMPTYTVLLAQNNLQQGASNNILAAVVAPIGTLAPTGTVTLQAAGTLNTLSSGPLGPTTSQNISQVNLPWTPTSSGGQSMQATYNPASTGQLTSASPVSQPVASTAIQPVSMRWPGTLYMQQNSLFQAILGTGFPDGSVQWSWDGVIVSPPIPTVNGVASWQWAPPSSGIHTISVSYIGGPTNNTQSGNSSQIVNVAGVRAVDNITVQPPGQPQWNIAQPISMTAGQNLTLAGTSQSGTTVLFSEQGPCLIAGATLTALSPGQCQVTAISPGNVSLQPGSETYTITITAPPRRPRR